MLAVLGDATVVAFWKRSQVTAYYHYNGVPLEPGKLDDVKVECAKYAAINGKSYNVYRLIGVMKPDGTFVDAAQVRGNDSSE